MFKKLYEVGMLSVGTYCLLTFPMIAFGVHYPTWLIIGVIPFISAFVGNYIHRKFLKG